MKKFVVLFFIALALMPQAVMSQAHRAKKSAAQRPRIGLVLGGGGAKGASHIGVLKYLEEQGIPIDYVAGTSMGSIIGGLYALGYSPEQMAKLISELDWSHYMSREIDPKLLSSGERQMRSNYLLRIPFNLKDADNALGSEGGISKAFIKSLPGSFVGGSNVTNLFNSLSVGYQDSMSYDRLPIPFACVATDVMSGGAYVMRSGRLPISMRASMAIPGVFDPVKIDGHLLLDGGMVNNFPVDICREMGADIIIGVEVSDGLDTNISQLQSLPQIASQLMQIAVSNKRLENRGLCNFYFKPDITGYNMLSFSKDAIDSLVNRGYVCAQKSAAAIDSLRQFLDGYGLHPKRLQAPPAEYIASDTMYVSEIDIDSPTREDVERQLHKIGFSTGFTTGKEIEKMVQRMIGTGAFTSIDYRLSPMLCPSDTIINTCYRLSLSPQNAEPHVFAAGLRYDNEESAAALFALGLNQYHSSGAKMSLTARLNYNPQVRIRGSFEGWNFGTLNLDYIFRECNYRIRSFSESAGTGMRQEHRMRLYFSEFQSRSVSLLVGAQEELIHFEQSVNKNTLVPINSTNKYYGMFGHITYDTRDKQSLARNGLLLNVSFNWRFAHDSQFAPEGTGIGDIMLYLRQNHTFGDSRFTGSPQIYTRLTSHHGHDGEFRTLFGGLLANRYGQNHLPFVGINNVQTLFYDAAIVRYDINFNIRGPHYISVLLNAIGGSNQHIFTIEDTSPLAFYYGGGLRYGLRSVLGLIAVDVFWSSLSSRWGMSVSIGYDI